MGLHLFSKVMPFFSCASSDRSAANQLERLLLFLTRLCPSTHSDSCAAAFPQTLTTEALAILFIRLAINSNWISLGQWEIAIVSLFIMVQRDNTTQQTPTTHPFIRCHHYRKWRSYFWGGPSPSLISPFSPLHSVLEDAHFAVSRKPFKLSLSSKPSSQRNQTVDAR